MTRHRDEAPTRLVRRLGMADAVVVGMGAMPGAGVFAALNPATRAVGNGLLRGRSDRDTGGPGRGRAGGD